jgi:hypothetical protein
MTKLNFFHQGCSYQGQFGITKYGIRNTLTKKDVIIGSEEPIRVGMLTSIKCPVYIATRNGGLKYYNSKGQEILNDKPPLCQRTNRVNYLRICLA